MSYLRYLCLFAFGGVQHILCCVFLRLVHPMLPVSLDCPFFVAPSVFSNVYLRLTDISVITLMFQAETVFSYHFYRSF